MAARLHALAVLAGLFVCGVDCARAGAQTPPPSSPRADQVEEPENDPPPATTPAIAAAAKPAATVQPSPEHVPATRAAPLLTALDPGSRPPLRPAKTHSAEPVATLPGFEMLPEGGSRLFVEISQSVGVEEKKTQRTLTYVLKGTRVVHRNNENALVTVHFNTPVTRARLLPSGRDLLFLVDLRADAAPAWKMVSEGDGTAALQIDFPKGSFLPAEGPDDTALSPETPPSSHGASPGMSGTAEPRATGSRSRSHARGLHSGVAPANPSLVGD